MKIETKFNIGDKVEYKIGVRNGRELVPCTFCDGSGKISGYDNSVSFCPVCNGRGKVPALSYREGAGIIQNIRVEYDSSNEARSKIMYMFDFGELNESDIVRALN